MIFDKFQMIFLLAIAANLDNLGVGISYGLQKRYIPVFSNLIIALISTVLTFFAMIFGQWLEHVLPIWAANDIGASIIIGVGLWVCWESLDRPSFKQIWQFFRSQIFHLKFKKTFHRLLNDTPIGGATTINSGVKYAVVYQMTAIDEVARHSSSYRDSLRSVKMTELIAVATRQCSCRLIIADL